MSELAAAYEHLPPQPAALVRGLVLLDLSSVTIPAAAAILAVAADSASATLLELVERGWLVSACRDRWELAVPAGGALAELAKRMEPAEPAALASRFVDYRLDAGDAGGAEIVAAVRSAARYHHADLAISLALTTWRRLRGTPARPWWHRLADVGEHTAIAGRAPADLAELLFHSGARFADAGDRQTAESQWVRALALAEQLGDHARFDEVLLLLADLYRGWGRLHKAMDALFELVAARRDHSGPVEVAEALERLGTTMVAARRPDSAADHLGKADALLDTIEDVTPLVARRHASVLVALGQVQEAQNATSAAKRAYSRALAMLTDLDEDAADEVRRLLAAAAKR